VDDAVQTLQEAGFAVELAPVDGNGRDAGTVAAQSPLARNEAPPAPR
jgi:hypothetical protein